MRTRGLSRSSKLKSEGRTPILAWPHDESNLSLWSNYWENEGWRADSTVKARLATNKKNVRAAESCRCWCTDPISSCFTTSLEYVFLQRNSERWGMGMCLQCHRRGALACRQDPRWCVQGSEDSIEPEEGVPGLHLLWTVEAYLIPLKNHRLDQSSWVFLIRIGINWETKFQG